MNVGDIVEIRGGFYTRTDALTAYNHHDAGKLGTVLATHQSVLEGEMWKEDTIDVLFEDNSVAYRIDCDRFKILIE